MPTPTCMTTVYRRLYTDVNRYCAGLPTLVHLYTVHITSRGRTVRATRQEEEASMSLLLSDADVRQAVNYTDLADCIEAALKVQAEEAAVVPARVNLEHSGTWLRVMPAIVPSANVMGLKVFHGIPGGGARYLILLYSVSDGSVLAAVDASYLTAARTAAT